MLKYILPAAKRVGADLLEYAVLEFAEVVSGEKKFKTTVKNVERQTLRKQLSSGSQNKTASRVIATKSAKRIVCLEEFFWKCSSLIMSINN